GIGGVMKRVVARRDDDSFEDAETKTEVGVEKNPGQRNPHGVGAEGGVAESSHEERCERHCPYHHDVDKMEPRARQPIELRRRMVDGVHAPQLRYPVKEPM